MATFRIREVGGSFSEREPTVGKWYVGLNDDGLRDGPLGEYIGDAEFCDDGDTEPFRLDEYDYIAEQA